MNTFVISNRAQVRPAIGYGYWNSKNIDSGQFGQNRADEIYGIHRVDGQYAGM